VFRWLHLKLKLSFALGLFCLVLPQIAVAQDKNPELDSLLRITAIGHDTSKVEAYSELCRLLRTTDTERSIRYGEQGISLALKVQYTEGEAMCRQSLGNAFIISSAYAKAMKELLLANELNKKLGNRKREADCLSNIAIIHLNMGNLGKAVENHAKALSIRELLKDSIGISNSLNNLGVLYTELNNPEQALANYTASLEMKERLGLESKLGVNLNNIAICYRDMKDSIRAKQFFLKSLENYRTHGDIEGEAMVLGNLGSLYLMQGLMEEAKAHHLLALQRHNQLGNIEGMCHEHLNLSQWYAKQNNIAPALAHADTALIQADTIGSLKLKRDAHLRLAEGYELKGETAKSLSYFKQYLKLNEQLQLEATSQQMAELQTRLETARIEGELDVVKAENQLNIERVQFEKKVGYAMMALLVLSLLLVALAAYAYKRKKEDNRILAEKNTIIEQKNTAILQSIHYAKRIQKAVLSTETRVQDVFPDSLILFHPKDIVSGDFFYVASRDGWDYAAVADCTGHGVPGAFVSILGHTELAGALLETPNHRPDQILVHLNERIRVVLRNEESNEVNDGMDIALCALHRATGTLEFCGALRPLAIVSTNNVLYPKATVTDGNGLFLHMIPGSRRPVGKSDRDTHFERITLQLQPGDRVFLFSDGFTDQFGGTNDKKFGNRAFRELLLSSSTLPMLEQQQTLESTLEDWMKGTHQTDDICVLGFSV
jgi:serine phosphatase RsbU (regulator of sigma subunit)